MARAATNDFLQGFRYHAVARTFDGTNPLQIDRGESGMNPQAGFQSITIPELSQDVVEYREGNSFWTAKQPGIPTVSDITLMRGVTKSDTTFFNWVLGAIQGVNYRVDLDIYHYARDEMTIGVSTTAAEPSDRPLYCKDCIPTRVKPLGDLDATASEVSLAEVDVAVERFAHDPAAV
jgi:phage tail-like protein